MKNSRRRFIKTGIAGLAGGVALSATLNGAAAEKKESTKKKLVYRVLGKTGIKLPVISMGTGDTSNHSLMTAALDAGVMHLATSNYYGNGKNEKIVGEVIKNRKRDSVVIATSVEPKPMDHKGGLFLKETSVDDFVKKFESGLKILGLDYVDILYIPFAGRKESVMFEPFMKMLDKLKKEGKIKYKGIATHNYMAEAIRAAADSNFYDVVMTAYNFRMTKIMTELNSAIDYAAKKGLGIIAMKTMAGGFFDKEKKKPINSTAALKWVLQNKNIHTVVPGVTTYDQLERNLAVMEDINLTEAEKEHLAQEGKTAGLFCTHCGNCIAQCSQKHDIPTMMRSYMYAHGYKNLAHAQDTFNNVDLPQTPCGSCSHCSVNCSMGFDIPGRIADIARIKNIPADFLV